MRNPEQAGEEGKFDILQARLYPGLHLVAGHLWANQEDA